MTTLISENTFHDNSTALDGFSCDAVLWAESHKEDEFRQLIEFPIAETLIPYREDQHIIDGKIRKFLTGYLPYHENNRTYSYNEHTPICYIRYRDITFLMAKPDTVMTRYTADLQHGIILFTDGNLFSELLDSYIFNCTERNGYIKPKVYPNKTQWKIAFSHYVLMKTGRAVYGEKVVHHSDHMRNNTSGCIEILGRSEHAVYHIEERRKGHYFNGNDYMQWLRRHWGMNENEIKNVEQNLKLLIEILPYFKGIEISDTLDLTRSFTYLSNKEIWEQVRLY